MPRAFTPRTVREIALRESGEAYLLMATITHPEIPDGVLRVVNNTEPIVSRGETFEARGFLWALPEDADDAGGEIDFGWDNIDQATTDWLRSITTPPDIVIEVIGASDPDVVELAVGDLQLRGASIDASRVMGKLMHEDVMNYRYPADIYSPEEWPGLY